MLDALSEEHDQHPNEVKRLEIARLMKYNILVVTAGLTCASFVRKLHKASLRKQSELASAGYTVRRTRSTTTTLLILKK